MNIHLPVGNCTHEPLVHVMVNLVGVEILVVQHFLDEILDILSTHPLEFLLIHQDTLALGESSADFFPWRQHVSRLGKNISHTIYHMIYYVT
jgi:hypothetical protein